MRRDCNYRRLQNFPEEKDCKIGIRPVGCFNEVMDARALREEIYNEVNPSSPVFGGHLISALNCRTEYPVLLCKCARIAKAMGYKYFDVNNFGKEILVVYHLQQLSGNSGWKVNDTRLFGSFQWKISGSNGTSEKAVLFFRTECSKRKFVYHFKPNL